MTQLSEESLLLVENWETVEDILKAIDRLKTELSSVLHSVESELVEQDWWHNGWRFVPHHSNQAYISRESWKRKGYVVWIGVERFDPERLFGSAPPAQFYVWTHNKYHDLAQALGEAIEESEEDVLGDVDQTQSGYIVTYPVSKYLPGDIDGFQDSVRREVLGFFGYWGQLLSNFDGIIEDYIAGLQKETSGDVS